MKRTEHRFQSSIHKNQIKGFNVLVDGKGFFDVPVKNKEKARKNY